MTSFSETDCSEILVTSLRPSPSAPSHPPPPAARALGRTAAGGSPAERQHRHAKERRDSAAKHRAADLLSPRRQAGESRQGGYGLARTEACARDLRAQALGQAAQQHPRQACLAG